MQSKEAVYLLNDAIEVYFILLNMSKVPTIRMNNGLQQPAVSFGTFAVSFSLVSPGILSDHLCRVTKKEFPKV